MCDARTSQFGGSPRAKKKQAFQPIHFASKTMNEAKTTLHYTEKELLAGCKTHARGVLLLKNVDIEFARQKLELRICADIMSRLEKSASKTTENKEINEAFPLETLGSIALQDQSTPWFADFANYHAGKFVIKGMTSQQKNKFFKDVSTTFGMNPFLFKICADHVIKKLCFLGQEALDILKGLPTVDLLEGTLWCQLHSQKNSSIQVLFGPTSTRMHDFCHPLRPCQRQGKNYATDEMPQKTHQVCEIFDIRGHYFMGPFPSSRGNKYILDALLDFLSKWVEGKSVSHQ
ncbi:hypothetical protein Tco_0212569 [Tanacetum coccineum]